MKNNKTWNEDLNWFDEEYYDSHEITAGSKEAIVTAFHEMILITWPNKKFGTTLRNIRQKENEWYADIRRFKTEALCRQHCNFPSTFKRTGVLL
tara:strand:+ start:156 stop:437 length:282 start_codon:yes stop_codon:yes gene_type:complete